MIKKLEDQLREKVWKAIEIIEKEKFFIHSEPINIQISSEKNYSLPMVSTLVVLNALVPRGTMILYGGYGGGKTTLVKLLGRMLAGLSIRDLEASIIRAHPQLTEEKMIGRLDVGKLLKEGMENIVWRNFIQSFWKIIDEINRLSPSAQDVIFSILSEGIAKYFDGIYETKSFVLYATINPRDVGTYPLGLPFLDRFGIAVPISSPSFDEISDLAETQDEKLHEYDDIRVPAILSVEELKIIWNLASRVPLTEEARLFISALAREFSLCARTKKEIGAFLQLAETICRGCHFNTENAICNKVFAPISVRATKDIARYSRALSWLLGLDHVPLGIVVSLSPYIIWHRISLSPKFIETFYGNAFYATKHLVDTALRSFIRRLPLYRGFMDLENGVGEITILNVLRESSPSDLIIAMDLYPNAEVISKPEYQSLVRELKAAFSKKNLDKVKSIMKKAKESLPANVYGRFMRVFERFLKQNSEIYEITFEKWHNKLSIIKQILTNSKEVLDRTISQARLEKISLDMGEIVIHTTGMLPTAPVYIEIYGLGEAEKVKQKIAEIFGKK